MQKKWKNLKDTFCKEIAADKKIKSGQAARKKKRPYRFIKELEFLAPQRSLRETTHNFEQSYDEEVIETEQADVVENKRLKVNLRKKKCLTNVNTTTCDDDLIQLLKDKKYDEDISFCKMLIPMIRNLSSEQKHNAKFKY